MTPKGLDLRFRDVYGTFTFPKHSDLGFLGFFVDFFFLVYLGGMNLQDAKNTP